MDNLLLLLLCIGLPILVIALYAYDQEQKKKKILAAKKNYEAALEQLRLDPGNNQMREDALALGRYYAALAKNNKRTMFDEVALMNDLNAIQATAQQANATQPGTGDVKARLANLDSLKNEGVITKEEYETRRQEILSEL